MKIPPANIGRFLQSPDPAVRVILFYGPDAGLVRERADTLARKTVPDVQDPFRVAVLTASSFGEKSTLLYDEMAAGSLVGGRRLVRLQHAAESNATQLAKVLADLPPTDTLLIIEAGDLDKRSKLRSLCDTAAPEVCAIPCYVEDAAARARTVTDILAGEGLAISRDLAALLADQLPPDRLAMRSELEKLALYAQGQKSLSLEDVQAVLPNAGAAEIDDVVLLVASGQDPKKVCTLLDHLWAEQVSCVAVLRSAQRHFIKLQWARAQMDGGLSAADAVKKLQPPVFWKFVATFTQQTQKWTAAKIERALMRLYEAEAAVKTTGLPDQTLTAQLLLQIMAM